MGTGLRGPKTLAVLAGAVLLLSLSRELAGVDLQPETLAAFEGYVRLTDARFAAEVQRPGAFLHIEGLPEQSREQVRAELKRGAIYLAPLETRDAAGGEISVPGGLVHHWLGAVFIPGARLPEVLSLVEDYNQHQNIYKPEVERSRLLSRDGNDFKVYYRLRKHKVITVTLDTQHAVDYTQLDATHCYSRSHSMRIAEVENAGRPDEREKPVGHDGGFLWRMESWWRFEERSGGVYVESESVSLTRDIPTGLGWLIKPFVTDIPKESLEMTLRSTRAAVLQRIAAERERKAAP